MWRRAKESIPLDPMNKVRFEFLSHAELCERLRESRKRDDRLIRVCQAFEQQQQDVGQDTQDDRDVLGLWNDNAFELT